MTTKLLDLNSLYGERVRVYNNKVNKLMSIQRYVKGVGWRLAGHSGTFALKDTSFEIKGNGQPHAFVLGVLIPVLDVPSYCYCCLREFRYSRNQRCFHTLDTGRVLSGSEYVVFEHRQSLIYL